MGFETAYDENGHLDNQATNGKSELVSKKIDETTPKPASEVSVGQQDIVYIHGARFWFICVAIAIIMFLVNLEIPVVITALVAITDDLRGFENAGWVVASYLLGYVGVIVICAKFSDIFGRKIVFLSSIVFFIIFSAACSAAQTIVQLIVFRAFQGIGGGGCWSLATILVVELVPPEQYAKFVANISIVNALALLLGPIVGGAVASNTTWRWIFIINIPIAVPALLISFWFIPKEFPHQSQPGHKSKTMKELMAKSTLDRIDIPGTILILFATLALTAAFEEADKQFPWRSAYVITLLTLSGLLWIALAVWERYVTLSDTIREPILPWRFLFNREMMGVLLNFVLLGGPTVICMFILPQRFQLVYGTSGLDAGVRLIPFTAVIPVGSIFASILAGKMKIPPVYLLVLGSILQVLGFSLIGTLPSTLDIPHQIYGFQILAGWGCGINFSLLFILIPFFNEKRDHAVALGAGSQFRFMGGAMVLAISTSVFNTYVRPRLESQLGISDADAFIQALPSLPQELQEQARQILAIGYNNQILVLAVSAALQCLAVFIHRLYFHPLSRYPGPLAARLSDFYGAYYASRTTLHVKTLQDHEKFGPVVRQGPNKLVFSSANALQVSQRAPNAYGLFNSLDRQMHQRKRKLLGPVVNDQSTRAFADGMVDQIDVFLKGLLSSCQQPATPVNMTERLTYLTMDIMGQFVFGYPLCLQTDATHRFMTDSTANFFLNVALQLPFLSKCRISNFRWLRAVLRGKSYRHILHKMIRSRLAEGKNAKHNLLFMTDTLRVSDNDDTFIEEIRSEATFFLSAGSDTMSTCLGAAFFYLSRNTECYQRLVTEIRTTFSSSSEIKGGPRLAACSYLRACIDESLRMSPPVPGTLWRQQVAGVDRASGPLIIDGCIIPPGTHVGVNTYALQHNEAYFPEPFTFKPERFLHKSELAKDAFAAFSLGARSCMGKSMAYLEASLVLAKTLWHFDFIQAPTHEGALGEFAYWKMRGRDDRAAEYQINDMFGAAHDGPCLIFTPRKVDVA
ncbi:hypothetical protein NUW58_g206 [Xylaria curta]|uniref:Uncharacterized protein n=1 Tax=Xylaria curta TaxID=42375 RepID=A0ACC1PS45_9PEZI|nr:hypothetical protein NUW58_g206 [Xylaria curta]